MTRKEYLKIGRKEFYAQFGYPKYMHLHAARSLYRFMIAEMQAKRPFIRIVMHHVNPACTDYELWECVPMYDDEHVLLHQQLSAKVGYKKGHKESEEVKAKRAAALRKVWHDPEWVEKHAAAQRGQDRSQYRDHYSQGQKKRFENPAERAKCNNGAIRIGNLPFNNGEVQIYAKECPDGFVHGVLDTKTKRFWITNGLEERQDHLCPEGWYRGRIHATDRKWVWWTNGIIAIQANAQPAPDFRRCWIVAHNYSDNADVVDISYKRQTPRRVI